MSTEDVYEAPVRAMLAPYSDGIGTVTYDRLWAAYHASDDYRRLIDAARAPLLAEIERLRHQLRSADKRIEQLDGRRRATPHAAGGDVTGPTTEEPNHA